jgi:hypothetical protein
MGSEEIQPDFPKNKKHKKGKTYKDQKNMHFFASRSCPLRLLFDPSFRRKR